MMDCFSLDMAGNLPISYQISGEKLHLAINLSSLSSNELKLYLCDNLQLENSARNCSENNLHISTNFSANAKYAISLKNNALLEFHFSANQDIQITSPPYMRLCVMELRMLAQNINCAAPYSRINLPENKKWHIRTDLHTHLTSQIKSADLLNVALAENAAYPIELLKLIGIETHGLPQTETNSCYFAPAASEGLACEQNGKIVPAVAIRNLSIDAQAKLAASMQLAPDEIITFDALERKIYRARNPLSKNAALITGTIEKIASDYAQSGVEYAELAVTAALDANWLAAALPAIEKAKTQFNVTLKLLIGLPRSLPPSEILTKLKMVMFASQHPTIVGVDFLGYETNKTRNFAWALSHFARFAAAQNRGVDYLGNGWDFADDFIIRVHAGENGKNPDNVLEVLHIANKHWVRVRVGHATYSDENESIKLAAELAKRNLVIMEFNPDSNLALNNIDCANDLPVAKFAKAQIPFVLASDGAGIYQTDAMQLLNAGIFAKLGEQELTLMIQTEKNHISHQLSLAAKKQSAFYAKYGNDDAFIQQMRQTSHNLHNRSELNGKIPLLIAGASGSSWRRISPEVQAHINAAILQIVQILNPQKIAFVMGRIKREGIGASLENALDAHYSQNPNTHQFDVIGMLSGQQNMPSIATYINHIIPLHGELMSVPTQMTNFLQENNGVAIYLGGSAFTRDFILCSQNLKIPFGVMADATGASSEKAKILPEKNVFSGEHGMIAWLHQNIPSDCFL